MVIPPDDGGGHPPHPDDKGAGVVGVVPGGDPEAAPLAAAALSAGAGADAAGTRSAAVAGTMLGILALASGLAWALYKFKPGLIPLGGAGARGAAAAPPSAASPLLGSAPAPPDGAPASGPAGSAPPPNGPGPDSRSVGTMPAAGYSSSGASGGGGGPKARGFGVSETLRSTMPESIAVGAAGAPPSLTSTMNRGIQTDVADGGGAAGLSAAGGAASSTFMQSTMVKNLYSADSSFADGSVLLFLVFVYF